MNKNVKLHLTTLEKLSSSGVMTNSDVEFFNGLKASPKRKAKYFCFLSSDCGEIMLFGFTQWRKVAKRMTYFTGKLKEVYVIEF